MSKNIVIIFIAVLSAFILTSCASSTGSRYEKEEEKAKTEEKKSEATAKKFEENFDFAPYHTKIEVDEPETKISDAEVEIWYEYPETESYPDNTRTVVDKKDGYRVQVTSTDNLDEANTVRSDIYFKTNQKNVYVIFDPPFYKVKVGDFLNISDANNLNFKLTQMGYTESRVVKDSVNIYQ